MIWWYGEKYEDKADALAQGAYENDKVVMLPIVTCRCCGENELDKIKSWLDYYTEKANKAFEAQQARPRNKWVSRASLPSWEQYDLDIEYEKNQAAAIAYSWVITLLEGKGGCL